MQKTPAQCELLLNLALHAVRASGWVFMPLDGKVPIHGGWREFTETTEDDLRTWCAQGWNLGLLTGEVSGVTVVDCDGRFPPVELKLPITMSAHTRATGDHFHLYYECAPGVGNSASKLAPNIDVRGDGGYVVFPGSIHPETGDVYRWSDPLRPMAVLPKAVVDLLLPVVVPPTPSAEPNPRYFEAALEREVAKVATAAEGTRNDTLNRASFKVGQLAHMSTNPGEAQETLVIAASTAGLPEREARITMRSGWCAGEEHARGPEETPIRSITLRSERKPTYVLTPGPHEDDNGDVVEISTAEFCDSVLGALPGDLLYERERIAGIIEAGRFLPLATRESLSRVLVDRHVDLRSWRTFGTGKNKHQGLTYHACNADLGRLIRDTAVAAARPLDLITPYPVFLPSWERVTRPGYTDGIWYEPNGPLEIIRNPEIIRATLEDLVVDFPFADDASRANFFGVLLTPIIRPAIDGNVPMHLVSSPVERTGKTKLIEDVLGGVLMGSTIPALQMPRKEDERAKAILALLMDGASLIHLDNLPGSLDSAALASLVTASTVAGRVLGVSQMVYARNRMTVCATANHVDMSPELAKRTVPIHLDTGESLPEMRTDYEHPDLRVYVASIRARVLGSLVGAVLNWRDAGAPKSRKPYGGFEAWAAAVGGILEHAGIPEWLGNRASWSSSHDPFNEALEELVARAPKNQDITVAELTKLASGLFDHVDEGATLLSKTSRMGKMLRTIDGRVIAKHKVTKGQRSNRGVTFRFEV